MADEPRGQKGAEMCPRSCGGVGLKPHLRRPSPALLHLPLEGLHTESLSLSTPKAGSQTGQQGPWAALASLFRPQPPQRKCKMVDEPNKTALVDRYSGS